MRDEMRILIVDDNVEFGNMLNEHIGQQEDMTVVGVAPDGLKAIEMIVSLKPDIVLLDIIMPNLDGIGVLERIKELKLDSKPSFIMLTAIGQDIFIQKAVALGVEYYVVKPFDVNVLVSRVRHVYREKLTAYLYKTNKPTLVSNSKNTSLEHSLEVEVTNHMHEIGIPPHMIGYQYIREAILRTLDNPKKFSSVTKVLYPAVADKFDTTPQKVERAIRNAIEGAWARGRVESLEPIFRSSFNYNKTRPTNSEFIAILVDKIRLELGLKNKQPL